MEFTARVGTPDGRVLEERHTANDAGALRDELEKKGLHVFELKRRGVGLSVPGFSRDKKGSGRRVRSDQFLVFNQELAALLRSGLPLLSALDLMVRRMEKGSFRIALEDIREKVRTGEDLSEAFADHGDLFPRLYPSILKAGERSGELEAVIRRFIRYLKLVIEARKQVVSALIYPAVLVGLSVAMLVVMMIFVVPKFRSFFDGMTVELPLLTRLLIATGTGLRDNWWLILLVVVGGWFAYRTWSRTDVGSLTLDRLRLKVPFLGGVLHRFSLSEFSRSLATLLAGGMPLVPSLEIAVSAVGNRHIREALEPTISDVRQGQAFHQALEDTGVFTDLAIDMVEVGEATGALDEMLGNVSDFLDEQVEVRMQRLLTLIEPMMLVFMGIIIGLILVALYLPLFSALSQTQG
jgi:type IV pilus assembly protein PilC